MIVSTGKKNLDQHFQHDQIATIPALYPSPPTSLDINSPTTSIGWGVYVLRLDIGLSIGAFAASSVRLDKASLGYIQKSISRLLWKHREIQGFVTIDLTKQNVFEHSSILQKRTLIH